MVGGAELQHFLCSSPIQELFFPHESDILLPAFLSLILTPTSPAMWSFRFPPLTALLLTGVQPFPELPSLGFPREFGAGRDSGTAEPHQAAEHFQVKLGAHFPASRHCTSSRAGPLLLIFTPGLGLLAATPSFGSTSSHPCLPGTKSTTVQTHSFGAGLKFPRAHSYGL